MTESPGNFLAELEQKWDEREDTFSALLANGTKWQGVWVELEREVSCTYSCHGLYSVMER